MTQETIKQVQHAALVVLDATLRQVGDCDPPTLTSSKLMFDVDIGDVRYEVTIPENAVQVKLLG